MVLYIFHVNTGGMLTFDMEMALQTVQNLKETIERLHGIPSINQVLLISGGEVLYPMSRVCSYSSGTDENPIYMFSTLFDNSKHLPPWPSIESHIHYEEEVNRCLVMPAEYNTVVIRAKLAHKMYESATKEIKVCEKLVFEQHLQQQGWAAVMANLEDLTNEFKQRSQDFLNTINDYVEQRPNYLAYLKSFQDDLLRLSTVPILNELYPSAQHDFHGFDEYFQDDVSYTGSTSADSGTSVGGGSGSNRDSLTTTVTTSATVGVCAAADSGESSQNQGQIDAVASPNVNDESNPSSYTQQDMELNEQQQNRSLTLLQWISTKENHKSLRDMAEDCSRVLFNFDDTAIKKIKGAIKHTLDNAEQESIREVRGLTQRLEQLDELMCSAKKTVQEQKELSTAFQQNQTRASNLGDASILPDLCMSHSSHLTVMLNNHNKLLDIEKRIMKAKEELGENLIKRLKYVVHIQNSISDLDSKLLFHHRCFRRLKHHLVIIEQIHHAPTMYVTAVTEVVRRRIFSNALLKWASDLSNHMITIHDEEIMRRQDFEALFEHHFLNALFTGLDDMPPAFATQAPAVFDNRLPNLSKSDVQMLAENIPDITSKIELPDLKEVLEFFASRYASGDSSLDKKITEKMKLLSIKPLDMHTHLKDGFESETDTEEFEKVGQSPVDRQKSGDGKSVIATLQTKPESITVSTSTDVVETQNIETLTEDNVGTAQTEVERLKQLILAMSQLSCNSIALLREQLRTIKDDTNCDQAYFAAEFQKIEKTWSALKQQNENNERELINRLTVDHELELTDVRKILTTKNDKIAELRSENNKLLEKLANTELDAEQNKTQTSDELDALKARIAELEKQLNNHEVEKNKAVNEIKERLNREHKTDIESLRCRYKLMKNVDRTPSDTSLEKIERQEIIDYDRSGGRSTLQPSSPTSGQSLYRRILDEKERQLDAANGQVELLTNENAKFKEIIQSLTDYEQNESLGRLKDQVEALQKDKIKLKQKLSSERARRIELSSNDKSSEAMSTTLTKSMTRSRLCSKKCVRIESCENNDNVLVVWNETLYRYIIAQESPYLHFLAEDSHPLFNLPVPNTKDVIFEDIQKPAFFVGIVTDKQFCMVKKEGTRYRVPIGTKFFRVRAKPLTTNTRSSVTSIDIAERHLFTRGNLPVSRSLSIQLIDSCAQTEFVESTSIPKQTTTIRNLAEEDMVDSGVVAPGQQTDRSSLNEDDEGAVSVNYDDRYRYASASEEDEAVIVDNPSSQENSANNSSGGGSIGFFTLIEPLITPLQSLMEK